MGDLKTPLERCVNKREREIVSKLAEILPEDYLIYSNIDFYSSSFNNYREGEIDILILIPQEGIIVIEVKGGNVYMNRYNNKWYRKKAEDKEEPIKDPFKQAIKEREELLKRIRKFLNFNIPIAYAVLLPDVEGLNIPPEYGDHIIFGSDLNRDVLKNKLRNIFKETVSPKISRRFRPLNKEQIKKLEDKVIFNKLKFFPSLTHKKEDEKILALTDEQATIMETLFGCSKRFLIKGYAGTGKTVVAYLMMKKLAQQRKKVLYVSKTKSIAEFIQQRIKMDGVEKFATAINYHQLHNMLNISIDMSYDSQDWLDRIYPEVLAKEIGKRRVNKYDAIFVDEGQNFKNSWWQALLNLLRSEDKSYFYIFYDPYQSIFSSTNPDDISQIESSFPFQYPIFKLTKVLRNTKKISEVLTSLVNVKYEYFPNHPEGEQIKIIFYIDPEDLRDKLKDLLKDLINRQKINPKDVIILSPFRFRFNEIEMSFGKYNTEKFSPEKFQKVENAILYTTLYSFIGLDSKIVIIVHLDHKFFSKSGNEIRLYEAISRGRTRVYLFVNRNVKININNIPDFISSAY